MIKFLKTDKPNIFNICPNDDPHNVPIGEVDVTFGMEKLTLHESMTSIAGDELMDISLFMKSEGFRGSVVEA